MFVSSPFRLLTDREIEELACTQGLMKNFDSTYLSGCAYDLRAGVILRSRNRESTFDLTKSEFHVSPGNV